MGIPKDRLTKNVESTVVTEYALSLADIHEAIVDYYDLPQITTIKYEAYADGASRHATVGGAVATVTQVEKRRG